MENLELILASGSPRRRELMARAGYAFTVHTSEVDESYPDGLTPAEVAPYLATLKARAVADELGLPRTIVIGADTVVALDGQIYGKPSDEEDARRMLRALSGKTHQVVTGVCVCAPDGTHTFADVTDVVFRELSDEEIATYVASGEPMDKAGAYGIQGAGGALVDHIVGDYDNVVGLPITRLSALLDDLLVSTQATNL